LGYLGAERTVGTSADFGLVKIVGPDIALGSIVAITVELLVQLE